MKTRYLSLVTAFILSLGAHAQYNYYWDPNLTGFTNNDTSQAGGDGTWSNTYNWWDYDSNDVASVDTNFGGSSAATYNLYFNGSANITKTRNTSFVGGSGANNHVYYVFHFESGTTTNLSAGDSTSGIAAFNFGNSTGVFNVGAGAQLNLAGNTNNPMYLYSGKNVSSGYGLTFQGGGTVNLDGVIIRPTGSGGNSRTLIEGGTTVNFNEGSGMYSADGDSSNPISSGELSRIVVNNGTFNINGGELFLGYKGSSSYSIDRSFGLAIGTTSNSTDDQAVVNLNNGTLTVLGDTRTSNPGTIQSGITFGGYNNTLSGGTFNLNGGTLITSNIRAMTTLETALLNLNGGTIVVSTDTVPNGTATALTNEQLQVRLDNFITGFAFSGETNGVILGEGGVRIDTSQIDTEKTTGIATISSNIRGTGNLTKVGENMLLLSGYHDYTGSTIIEGGTLAIGNLSGNDTSSGIARSEMILIKDGAVFDTTRRSSTYYNMGTTAVKQLLTNEGSGKVVGNINADRGVIQPKGTFIIDGRVGSTANSAFKFEELGTDILSVTGTLNLADNVTLDLSDATLTSGSFNLFIAESISYGDFNIVSEESADYTFSFDKYSLDNQEILQMTVAAIPEPADCALILSLAAAGMLLLRRSRRN